MATTDKLPALMESLPQELYDRIHELTFEPTSADIEINKHYVPPAVLQVSRSTRATYEAVFYSTTTFRFININDPSSASPPTNLSCIGRWLRSLHKRAFECLADVVFVIPPMRPGTHPIQLIMHSQNVLIRAQNMMWKYAVDWQECHFLRVQLGRSGPMTDDVASIETESYPGEFSI